MEPTTIHMDAPPGKTYRYNRVRFSPGLTFIVNEDTAVYLTGVLKGDGQPLFRRGAPKYPILDEDGKPLPPLEASALRDEQARADEEEERAVKDLSGEPEDQPEEPQKEGKAPARRTRRSKQE